MNDNSVTKEIRALIESKINAGVVVRADWVAAGILAMKDKIDGDDVPFYRVCAYRDIVRIARSVVDKYDATDDTPEQLVLPGFKHLCKAYPMIRDGIAVLVPVTLCTTEELIERAARLEEMAKGCRAHAREILDYVAARKVAAA